jgi:putative spermidine/putrescine transport system substrate-binding protein
VKALSVLSWRGRWGEALTAAVSKPFERETGIEVVHRFHVGLALPEALSDALASGTRPPVDVVWSNSAPALRAAAVAGCVPLDRDVLGDLRNRARPEAAGLPCVHPYSVQYVLCYQRSAYPREPPRSWGVLTASRHRGQVAMYPAGHGFFPIAQAMGGGDVAAIPYDMDPCWSWSRLLRGQIGVLDYSIGMEQRLRRGELTLCFRALPNVVAFQDAGADVDWATPDEGTTDTVDALWIPSGVSESVAEMAAEYIAFALRADIQRDWCERLGVLPMHRDADRPSVLDRPGVVLPEHADDQTGILFVPEAVKAVHEDDWGRRWSHAVGETDT